MADIPDVPQRIGQAPTTAPAVTVWTMRLLAFAGLLIALFLSGVHFLAAFKAQRVKGPYCQILSFFDCDTVLNSEWATWFGVPVPLLGAAAYVALLAVLWRKPRHWNWWALCIVTGAIAGAAGWFIYLQSAVLGGTFCLWCMAEHAIGLTLFLLVWLMAFAAGVLRRGRGPAALVLAAVPVALLIAGQHLDTHHYFKTVGTVEINAAEHLLLGSPGAEHIIVEAIDYTCPRCRNLARLVPATRQILGPGYAFIVLTTPLHPGCNHYYAVDFGGAVDERHQHACDLAELAHAVSLAAPARFEEFHGWLFEQQDRLRTDPAPAFDWAAQVLGGSQPLIAAVESVRAAERVARDVEVAAKLGFGPLPGLLAADRSFTAIPEDAATLAEQLRMAFWAEGGESP